MKTIVVLLLAVLAILLNRAGAGHLVAQGLAAADRYGFVLAGLVLAGVVAQVRWVFRASPENRRIGVAR